MATSDTSWSAEPLNGTAASGGTAPQPAQQPMEMIQQGAQQAQAATGRMADQARQQVSTQLNGQKDRATSTLDSVAQALRQTGQQLQDQGQAPIAGYTTKAAEQVERVTRYLNERDVTDLQGDAARLARTQPVLFVAGAFALGWLGARFFKSAAPAQAAGQNGASTMRPALPSSTPDISYAGMQADTWTDTADVSAQDSALAQPRSVTRSSSAL